MKKVGVVHVNYLQRGGEDVHVDQLMQLYPEMGYQALRFPGESSSSPKQALGALTFGQAALWDAWYQEHRPDLLHLHNIHPTLGPAFLRWVHQKKIPTIATMHNHRFYCTNGLALYKGSPCKACLHSAIYWRPLLKNCNLDWGKSAYHAAALSQIRLNDLLNLGVQRFLAPSPYMVKELAAAGINPDKITLVPHPVELLAPSESRTHEKEFDFIYAGRLSEEKGVHLLAEAAALLPNYRFAIAGNGPLQNQIEKGNKVNISLFTSLSREEAHRLIGRARMACVPSICEESFSLFAAEGLLSGLKLAVAKRESLQWLTLSPFHAFSLNTHSSVELAKSLEAAIKSPAPPDTNIELNNYYSRNSFQSRLAQIVQSLPERAE